MERENQSEALGAMSRLGGEERGGEDGSGDPAAPWGGIQGHVESRGPDGVEQCVAGRENCPECYQDCSLDDLQENRRWEVVRVLALEHSSLVPLER